MILRLRYRLLCNIPFSTYNISETDQNNSFSQFSMIERDEGEGLVGFGLVWLCLVWFSLVWFSLV